MQVQLPHLPFSLSLCHTSKTGQCCDFVIYNTISNELKHTHIILIQTYQ